MTSHSSAAAAALTLAIGLFAAGCADADPSSDLSSEASEALGSTVSVPNPSGAYFASVTASGTGCPAGTWDATLSPDGKSFKVELTAYEAAIEPGLSMAILDCTLSIDLRSPDGLSFSVSSFRHDGYVTLDQPGMHAYETAKYYFQGNPIPPRSYRSDFTGPYDNSFVFSDNIGVADLVWSPCGTSRRLNLQTRLAVLNNSARTGAGFASITQFDTFELQWRRC